MECQSHKMHEHHKECVIKLIRCQTQTLEGEIEREGTGYTTWYLLEVDENSMQSAVSLVRDIFSGAPKKSLLFSRLLLSFRRHSFLSLSFNNHNNNHRRCFVSKDINNQVSCQGKVKLRICCRGRGDKVKILRKNHEFGCLLLSFPKYKYFWVNAHLIWL